MRRGSTTRRSSRTSWTARPQSWASSRRVVAARAGRARVTVAMPGGPTLGHADVTLKPGINDVKLGARIEKPELWWPAGLGPQRLYTLETRLADSDGKVRDVRTTRIGLRTIEVVHERDKEGKSFFIKVNGAPVFMKGANWIPADSFVTRMTDERYRFLLQSAVDANMNMLRVWGGGIYEDNRFYDLARRAGPAGVAGLHVRVQHVPGRRAVRRERPPGSDRKRPPAAQPPQPGAVGG